MKIESVPLSAPSVSGQREGMPTTKWPTPHPVLGDFQELRAISVCLLRLLCFEYGLYFRY